jgi:hypothetical protein
MYQAEAMWINFNSDKYPFAVKIAAGKINAETGLLWTNELSKEPQDYVVLPDQPWLDGFCVQNGLIRQFVALPLGSGYSAEEQITGKAEFGGVQIVVYPMKREHAEPRLKSRVKYSLCDETFYDCPFGESDEAMGLAPGGLMRQEIFEDEYGEDVWETGVRSRCYVHLLNSEQYRQVTGENPPMEPPDAADYTKAGLPWFDYYGKDKKPLPGSQVLSGLHSVGAKQVQKGEKIIGHTEVVDPQRIIRLGADICSVSDGIW